MLRRVLCWFLNHLPGDTYVVLKSYAYSQHTVCRRCGTHLLQEHLWRWGG